MVKFKVPLKDILQNAYYQYELTSSNYDPQIDTAFTITCSCRNVLGNPIANKELTLYENGNEYDTATTNANGIATWTITPTLWGKKHYAVENTSIDLDVGGWKQIKSYASGFYTLSINGLTRTAKLRVSISNTNIASGENYRQDGWVTSSYRPNGTVIGLMARLQNVEIVVSSGGNVYVYNPTSSTVSGFTSSTIVYWDY